MADSTPDSEVSLKALVQAAVVDLQRLIKAQVALAKLEITQAGMTVAKTSGMLIGALTFAFIGFIFLLVTLAYGINALGLPVWASFGIVTLLLIIVAVVLALLGKREAGRIKGPEKTMEEIDKTKFAITEAVGGNTAVTALKTYDDVRSQVKDQAKDMVMGELGLTTPPSGSGSGTAAPGRE